jgi:DNA-binding GntR family transcriptional regulator
MDFSGISRRSDRWVHEQIADVIEKAIWSGELEPREMLPSEQEIIHQAGVSRWAVRRALALLREKGTIYTRAHLGSFVSERKSE